MGIFVPRLRTLITPGDALDAIADAYEAECGGEIPGRLLLALGAQSALETAQWKSCWNWNFGNIRGEGPDGRWTTFRAGEIENGHEVILEPGPTNKFAAYLDRMAGGRAFVRFLCVAEHPPFPNRYQPAIDAATRGDLAGFVHGLAEAHYFTANEGEYLSAEKSEANWLEKLPEMQAWLETVP